MSKAIDDLKHEHEAILFGLKILKGMVKHSTERKPGLKVDFQRFIGFLKEFADKCHHGKEEGILFPAMVGAGMIKKGGPMEVMLAEHVQARNLVQTMEDSLNGNLELGRMTIAAKEYSTLLDNHIQKENNVLFVMAEKILRPDQLDMLYAAFEEHEEKVIGKGRHEELHAILKDLKTRYL